MFFSIVSIIEIKRIALKAVKTTEKPQTGAEMIIEKKVKAGADKDPNILQDINYPSTNNR